MLLVLLSLAAKNAREKEEEEMVGVWKRQSGRKASNAFFVARTNALGLLLQKRSLAAKVAGP